MTTPEIVNRLRSMRDEVALQAKQIVDVGGNAGDALDRAKDAEALNVALHILMVTADATYDT